MALTRIENNQISNAVSGNAELGINGNLKLQEYTVTGSRLANDLSYGSNFSASGNVTAGNIFTGGQVSATGNVTGNYILGNIACATGYTSNTIYNGNSNVLIATADGNITMSVAGTPNVAVVTATGLEVTGTASASGNITGANLNTAGQVTSGTLQTTGNAIIGGDLVVNGNLTYVNVTDLNVEDPIIGLGRGPNNTPLVSNDGKDRGEQLWYYNANEKSAFTGYQNLSGKILLATDVSIANEIVTVNSLGNVVAGNLEGTTVSVTGNATAGNVLTSGIVSATGTATAGNVATGGTVSATGNIQGGNILTAGVVSATGNITANFYSGNGRQLTGQGMSYRVTAANSQAYLINGGYPNTTINLVRGQNYFFEITANSHPLWIKTDPVIGTGNAYSSGVTNNGAGVGTVGFQVPFNAPNTLYYQCQFHVGMYGEFNITDGTAIQNGNSNVQVYGNGNVATSIGGTSNVMVVTSSGVNVTGDVSASGNVTGGNVLFGSGIVSGTGNVYADTVFANVSGNISGNVTAAGSNTQVQFNNNNLLGASAGFTFDSNGNVLTANGNINGANLFTGGTVSATSNITGGNILTGGIVSATGNITADYYFGNGSQLTGIDATSIQNGNSNVKVYANGNVAVSVTGVSNTVVFSDTATDFNTPISANGNITGGNLLTGGAVSATGTATAGNLATAGTITATGTATVGNLATAGDVSATGTVTAGNIFTGGTVSAAGNVIAAVNLEGGNVFTNGVVSATGNATAGNILTGGIVSATSTVQGGNIVTAGDVTATGSVTGGNVFTGGVVSATSTVTGGNIATAGTVTATGTITGGNIATGGTVSATGTATAGNVLTGGVVSATGNITAGSGSFFIGNGSQLTGVTATNVDAGNLTGNTLSSNVVFSSLTTVGTLTSLSVSGTTVTGNLDTAGAVSATGTITGGNVLTSGIISATGTITSANTITGGNINTAGAVSATGTATVGNLDTGGTVSATGTATAGNVATGGTVSATGTITGGNILTGGLISATGNVTGNYFFGNGSQLTGIDTNLIKNGDSNVRILTANGNISMDVNGTSNVVVVTQNGIDITGTVSASGNVTGQNLFTGGSVSAVGDVTANNVRTSNVISTGQLDITSGSNGNILIQPNGTGNIVLANTYINGLQLTPQQDADAASKYYVDLIATTGITYHEGVFAATVSNLATATGGTITYTQPNGASNGVGAQITTTGSFNLIDTANVQTVGTRILVKNEGNAVLNGIYTWANATTIVRSTDADQYGSSSSESISLNDYFFVESGNTLAGSAWVVDAPQGTITFGTSNITFAQFSQAQTYFANTNAGLSLIGQTFNAKVDNNTTAFDGGGNISVKAGANLTTPNIGAATGTSLSLTGNVVSGNVFTGGEISAVGTAHAGNLHTPGIVTATGNIIGANVFTGGEISATGAISSANNVSGANLFTGGTVSAAGTVTGGNVSTAGFVTATGTVTGGNVSTAGFVTATGTVTGGNIDTAGTVSATGTVTGGNVLTGGLISATGNVTGNYFIGNGSQLTGVTAASMDAGNLTGNTLSSNVVFSSLTTVGTLTSLSVSGTTTTGNLDTAGAVSATGTVTGGNVLTGGQVSATGTGTFGNVLTGGIISATGTITSANTITGGNLLTGGVISATGTATVGNVLTGGIVSATGTATAGNILTAGEVSAGGSVTGGNIFTGGLISATSTITGGNIATAGTVTATGNVTGGNITTGGIISATGTGTFGNVIFGAGYVSGTGNIYAGNIFANITGNVVSPGSNTEIIFNDGGITGASPALTFNKSGNVLAVTGTITATGTVTGGNIATAGTVSAAGNITAGSGSFFIGNGSQLTDVTATSAGFPITAGTSNIAAPTANGNISVTVNGTANVAVFANTGAYVTGEISATGNISANYYFGNGSQLTGIITSVSNVTNGNSNIDIASPGSNITVAVDGVSNVAVFTPVGISANNVSANNVSASGNVTGNIVLGTRAVFGTSLTPVTGATVTINATDSMLMPVGNTAQRPTGTTGMVRYNTTEDSLEVFNGTVWVSVGNFTVIVDDQFAGDDSTLVFTLSQAASTFSVIVSINGVVQIPTTAYTVTGTTLTFSEAPAAGDDIDVRILTTTTTVAGISNGPGNASISVSDTSNVISVVGQLQGSGNVLTVKGDLAVTGNVQITGNIATNQINNGTSAVQIPTASGNVNIDVGAIDNLAVFTSDGMSIVGNIDATGNVTAQNVNSLSDASLKENIVSITNAGAVVDGLNGVGYDWKDGSGHAYGMIAQAVEEILPEAVSTDANGIKSINYNMVVPFLVETVKELRQDIAEIKSQIKK
jgi:hypothetical protein